MRILLATNNQHKAREFTRILPEFSVLRPIDVGLDFDFPETGTSFLENAYGKALHLLDAATSSGDLERYALDAVWADDSGICVHALENRPGVYSARYGDTPEAPAPQDRKNQLLLRELSGSPDRNAHYVCCAVAALTGDRFAIVQEAWHGQIASRPSEGTGGFGYDPVFFLPDLGCTAADISDREKDLRSHRGKAARRLAAALLHPE